MKKWRNIAWENCETCGDDLESLTDETLEHGLHDDGDEVRCAKGGYMGHMSCDGEQAWVSYDDEAEHAELPK